MIGGEEEIETPAALVVFYVVVWSIVVCGYGWEGSGERKEEGEDVDGGHFVEVHEENT